MFKESMRNLIKKAKQPIETCTHPSFFGGGCRPSPYAHTEIVVAFFVGKLFDCLVIAS